MILILYLFIIRIIGLFIFFRYYLGRSSKRKLFTLFSPIDRGEFAERKIISKLRKTGINPKAIFHNLYVQKPNGDYSQVDIVVATKVGLLVFEVKEYNGWIFGNDRQKYWTQILAYGKQRHRFYNPIMQNMNHINTIRQRIHQNPGIPIYSIIVFLGSCVLKNVSYSTDYTYVMKDSSFQSFIKRILNKPEISYGNKYEIMELLTTSANNGNNPLIVNSHIKRVSSLEVKG